jgi:periodic tryptophan protein 2
MRKKSMLYAMTHISILRRYRNFRTFASPRPAQFSCLAVDDSGEVVCAGSLDTFEIFLWSMQTGRLLEVFHSIA